jgi:hypothetical protein
MAITLITRASNGAPLTAAQHDTNLSTIKGAVDTLQTDVATAQSGKLATSTFDSLFEPTVAGKKQITWANVINKPVTTLAAFSAYHSSTTQDIVITGSGAGLTGSAQVQLNAESFDPDNVFNTSTYVMTAPITGYYQINAGLQLDYISGTPSLMSILFSIRVNGNPVSSSLLPVDSALESRIYNLSTLLKLTATNIVDLYVDIGQTNAGTWRIAANSNTSLSGHLVSS